MRRCSAGSGREWWFLLVSCSRPVRSSSCCSSLRRSPAPARGSRPGSAPVLGYAFSEGAGATVSDVSGNGRTGTLESGAAWTASGRFGAGLLLDGIDDGVQTPSAAGLDPMTAVTFEGWVSVGSAPGDGAIWARVSGPDVYRLAVVAGGQVDVGAAFSGSIGRCDRRAAQPRHLDARCRHLRRESTPARACWPSSRADGTGPPSPSVDGSQASAAWRRRS